MILEQRPGGGKLGRREGGAPTRGRSGGRGSAMIPGDVMEKDVFLVTGGTGFLGVAIIRLLLDKGSRVRILVRTPDAEMARVPGVEMCIGSVTDLAAVERACQGVRGVFHLVGIVEHSRAASANVRRINIDGTVNVMEAAGRAGCKVVFASTSGTVAVSRDKEVRGDADGYASDLTRSWPYYASKEVAERAARAVAARTGTPLVILRPTSILGPGETTLKAGKSLEYYRKKSVYKHITRSVPYLPEGGLSFVDVRDCAAAFVQAMGRPEADGLSMCLGGSDGSNMTLKDFFAALQELSGVPSATRHVPFALAWAGISALHFVTSKLGKPYHVDPVVVEMANHFWFVDSSLAEKVLGFRPRPWRETLCDSLEYIQKHGHEMGLPKGLPKIDITGECSGSKKMIQRSRL